MGDPAEELQDRTIRACEFCQEIIDAGYSPDTKAGRNADTVLNLLLTSSDT